MSSLHIVFSPSAAPSLRAALDAAGKPGRVIALMDDLSFGPIDPPDSAQRAEWVGDTLGWDWDDLDKEVEAFWSEALTGSQPKVAWFSRRSTGEFCGFLEWLRRIGDQHIEVIDLTDVRFPLNGDSGAPILAPVTPLILPSQFSGGRLWDLAKPLSSERRQAWSALWDNLREENAPFRVLTSAGLESAPLDVFDNQILRHIGDEWSKASHVIGHVLYESAYESFCPAGVQQVGDLVLIARLAALIGAGRVEAQGDPYALKTCVVRLKGDGGLRAI